MSTIPEGNEAKLEKARLHLEKEELRQSRELILEVLKSQPEAPISGQAVSLLMKVVEQETENAIEDVLEQDQMEMVMQLVPLLTGGRPLGVLFVGWLSLIIWSLGGLLGFPMVLSFGEMLPEARRQFILVTLVIFCGAISSFYFLRSHTWAYGVTIVCYFIILFDSMQGANPSFVGIVFSSAVLLYLVASKTVRRHFGV